jgi:curved DNA-binding protein CbpA
MDNRDPYAILQVSPMAEIEVIEVAYRRLALKYHPDRYFGPDANEIMKELNWAYSVLRDPIQRRNYDENIIMEKVPLHEKISHKEFDESIEEESAQKRIESAKKILDITTSTGWMFIAYFVFIIILLAIFPQSIHQYLGIGLCGVLFIIYLISSMVRDRLITKSQRQKERREIEEETYRGR